MVGDQSMERFRNEYEKLHRALKTSYESEKRLVKRYSYISNFVTPIGGLTNKFNDQGPNFEFLPIDAKSSTTLSYRTLQELKLQLSLLRRIHRQSLSSEGKLIRLGNWSSKPKKRKRKPGRLYKTSEMRSLT